MSDRAVVGIGIVGAFALGIGAAVFLHGNYFSGAPLTGDVTAPTETNQAECTEHEQCPSNHVCRLGQCEKADRSFCSQPFMLAESLENRFIRYTVCPTRCIQDGTAAHCE
jgi:hypothetical protein